MGRIGRIPADHFPAEIGAQYLQVTMATVVVLVALFIGGGVLRGVGGVPGALSGDGVLDVAPLPPHGGGVLSAANWKFDPYCGNGDPMGRREAEGGRLW